MAGHSQFKNIMHRKGAQDAKRARLFSKISREISVACRAGMPDPDHNPRLRSAIALARSAQMPRDNIERAMKKASGGDSETYEEIRYEGFAPGGVSLIVEALTDNRNRTASDVRAAFSKHGGNLGTTGSVSHIFTRCGLVTYPANIADQDRLFELALEAGADDVVSDDDGHEIFTSVEQLRSAAQKLEEDLGEPSSTRLVWRPNSLLPVAESTAATLIKLLDVLEDNDDVQHVYGNYDIPQDLLETASS